MCTSFGLERSCVHFAIHGVSISTSCLLFSFWSKSQLTPQILHSYFITCLVLQRFAIVLATFHRFTTGTSWRLVSQPFSFYVLMRIDFYNIVTETSHPSLPFILFFISIEQVCLKTHFYLFCQCCFYQRLFITEFYIIFALLFPGLLATTFLLGGSIWGALISSFVIFFLAFVLTFISVYQVRGSTLMHCKSLIDWAARSEERPTTHVALTPPVRSMLTSYVYT